MLKAEKALKKEGIKHELVPVPRNLSTDCGMCIRIEGDLDISKLPAIAAGLDKFYVLEDDIYKELTKTKVR